MIVRRLERLYWSALMTSTGHCSAGAVPLAKLRSAHHNSPRTTGLVASDQGRILQVVLVVD